MALFSGEDWVHLVSSVGQSTSKTICCRKANSESQATYFSKDTVPSTKTVDFPLLHSLANMSVVQ